MSRSKKTLSNNVKRDVKNWGVDPEWAHRRMLEYRAAKDAKRRFEASMATAWEGATPTRPLPIGSASDGHGLSLSRGVGSP